MSARAGEAGAPGWRDAHTLGLAACPVCGLTVSLSSACPRCGARPSPPSFDTLQSVWAFLAAGIIAYIPANLLPMLVTVNLGQRTESTIAGGAIELFGAGSWFVGGVVLVASVVIPVMKFVVIAYLALAARRRSRRNQHQKHRLHAMVELIGRWSMIDVFVVAILAALIQLGLIASVEPGPAAGPFALSVIFTMLSAQRLDPRLIWTTAEDPPPEDPPKEPAP